MELRTANDVRRQVMIGAWRRAQKLADYYGVGTKIEYFKEALKAEWSAIKKYLANQVELKDIETETEVIGEVVEVAGWIASKNIPEYDHPIVIGAKLRGEVKRETEKAVFVVFEVELYRRGEYHSTASWFPKSQCKLVQKKRQPIQLSLA